MKTDVPVLTIPILLGRSIKPETGTESGTRVNRAYLRKPALHSSRKIAQFFGRSLERRILRGEPLQPLFRQWLPFCAPTAPFGSKFCRRQICTYKSIYRGIDEMHQYTLQERGSLFPGRQKCSADGWHDGR